MAGLAAHATEMDLGGLIGRGDEAATLLDSVAPGSGFRVVFLHGIAGIGKSALLVACLDQARRAGNRVVDLDARNVEPTETGFLGALSRATGLPGRNLDVILADMEHFGPALLAVDNVENIRLLDTWLRRILVPALPPDVRVVLAGREPPVAAWLTAPGLEGRIRTIPLGPLAERHALRLLGELGVPMDRARMLNRIARGHPLALRLAAATQSERPDRALDEIAAHRVIDELARLYLAEVRDPDTRAALEAASVVRRVTRSLLRAVAPGAPPDCFERLADLPFIESRSDGLLIHDAVREAIARHLHAVDPSAYREHRRRAWRRLSLEVQGAAPDELWRYTADMLYLIENPIVREAFFPSGAHPLTVEPAPGDALPALETISARHDGPTATALMRRWWARAPGTFSVIRDRDSHVTGYFQLLTSDELRSSAAIDDPVVDAWNEHLRAVPVPRGQLVLGLRRWLDLEHGETPSSGQAASWLDVKRTYMALRPRLRRIYVVVRDAATYWPVVEPLGFRLLPERTRTVSIGDDAYTSVVLDFGPRSVDAWLAGLVAAELGLSPWGLDEEAHELSVDDRRIRLTPLEFAVFDHLRRIPGRTVARRELLQEVWGWDGTASSNVVDVVVRRLRHKLDGRPAIETVRGAGYRLSEG